MLELMAIFLVVVGSLSLVMGYSLTSLIYALMISSILVTLVGSLRGPRPQ